MTFTDLIVAIVIMGLFFSGFSRAAYPLIKAVDSSIGEYRAARSMAFVAASFRNECGQKDRNIERWKTTVSSVNELESYTIEEIWDGTTLRALRAHCVVSGQKVEIIGLCEP
jgi:hypothetical protein